ncbi:MAG TPA: alkaline phosphatase family protein [Thermoanaerobaculia bacterium]|nr:alkaline phosphatase family protein [Thermoanaerobaculia bacterium]
MPTRLLLALLLALPGVFPAAAADPPKTIVLGFDGVDADLTRQWMAEGKLPNLARLRDQGSFAPLRSTIPSQTPVSWSTFATGLNPGRHAIFDFLKRDTADYRPSFAMYDEGREPFLWGEKTPWLLGPAVALGLALLLFGALKLFRVRTRWAVIAAAVVAVAAGVGTGVAAAKLMPKERPVAINRRQGDTFWELLGKSGARVRVLRMPVTFPPKPYEHGELLTGLGTPDMSGRIGKPFYFTSELFFTPKGGGDFSVEVVELVDNRGVIETEVKGPPNELFPDQSDYVVIPMELTVPEDRSRLEIEVSGTKLALKPGEWSDWVRFTFPFNALIKARGIGKFRLLSLDPEVRLYLSPIEFDPEGLPPGLAITYPGKWVDELTGRFGLFKTKGWTIDTWSLSNGTADEKLFLEDVEQTVAKDKEMLFGLLADDDWDVLVDYFEFTDRVQHMMFRFFDPRHPLYTPEGAAKWGGSILAAYQEMDGIVGEVMRRMPAGTRLFVLSDHGFASFRRSMNYNTWLAKNGFMTLTGEDAERKNLEDLFDQGDFFVNVDWSKTRAYALGLGQVYINLAGREKQGIVRAGEEYRQVAAAIKAGLEAYVDPATGEKPVAHVFTRDEAYGVYDPELIPDLIPSNNDGYRVGWQDTLGGIAKEVVEDNTEIWSGDHCSVYPPLVEGILFSTEKLDTRGAYMGDVMPTLLALHGVQPTVKLDGRSLLKKGG